MNIFKKRLIFVVGKGGVGKTTVAVALALAAVRRGKRTLLIEMEGNGRIPQLLGFPPRAGETPHAVDQERLFFLSLDGKVALEEYLRLIIPIKRFLRVVFDSKIYQYFVAAAPGLKELMAVGKIWYEAQRKEQNTGSPRWDLIIVDAAATGHSLQYLRMPQVAEATFGAGLVRREAHRVTSFLRDREKTVVGIVTTAEEIPVGETIEIYHELVRDLKMAVGLLFVNRFHAVPVQQEELNQCHRAAVLSHAVQERALIREVWRRAHEERCRAEMNAHYLDKLTTAVPLPVVRLPFLFAEEFGLTEVTSLSSLVEEGITGIARPLRVATQPA